MDKNCDLEDPLVHDDDGDVESPPLEDREHRADRRHVPHLPLLHRPRDAQKERKWRTETPKKRRR